MEKLEGLPVAPFMDRDKVRYFFVQFSTNWFIYWLVSFIYLFSGMFDCLFAFSALPSHLYVSVCLCVYFYCWKKLENMHFHSKIAWPPGAYDVISRNHSNWPCVFCPSQVTKPSAQIGFIRFVLIPLFEALEQLFPVLEVLNTHLFKFFSTAIQLPTKSVSI